MVQLASTSTVLSMCSPKAARREQDILCFMATGRSAGHVHIARPSLQWKHAGSRRYRQHDTLGDNAASTQRQAKPPQRPECVSGDALRCTRCALHLRASETSWAAEGCMEKPTAGCDDLRSILACKPSVAGPETEHSQHAE